MEIDIKKTTINYIYIYIYIKLNQLTNENEKSLNSQGG